MVAVGVGHEGVGVGAEAQQDVEVDVGGSGPGPLPVEQRVHPVAVPQQVLEVDVAVDHRRGPERLQGEGQVPDEAEGLLHEPRVDVGQRRQAVDGLDQPGGGGLQVHADQQGRIVDVGQLGGGREAVDGLQQVGEVLDGQVALWRGEVGPGLAEDPAAGPAQDQPVTAGLAAVGDGLGVAERRWQEATDRPSPSGDGRPGDGSGGSGTRRRARPRWSPSAAARGHRRRAGRRRPAPGGRGPWRARSRDDGADDRGHLV